MTIITRKRPALRRRPATRRVSGEPSGWSSAEAASPAAQSLPTLAAPERFRFSGSVLLVVGLLLVGFVAQFIGVSQISASRDQQLAVNSFRYDLANATAPVGQTGADGKLLPLGTPVAMLSIPKLGVSQVVVEGTNSDTTRSGPGHRRDTPLPGQIGASVVYGRQAAYGAPFGNLADLKVGDTITTTTGQGVSKYTVTDLRRTGDPVPAPIAAGGGRLTLVTAAGTPFLPGTILRVDAKLVSTPLPTPTRVLTFAALAPGELTMAGDGTGWPLLVLALVLMFAAIALLTLSRRFWGRLQTWIVAVPVLVAIGLFVGRQVTILLPNLM